MTHPETCLCLDNLGYETQNDWAMMEIQRNKKKEKKGTSRFKFSRWGGGGGDGDGGNSRHWSRMGLIQDEFSVKMFPIYKMSVDRIRCI